MSFPYLSGLVLFCLVLSGVQASQTGEEYWQSVWPNTPVPKVLWDLLQPPTEAKLPIEAGEMMQYWTAFFEHDLHPGKKISLGFHKHSKVRPLGEKISSESSKIEMDSQVQPSVLRMWAGKASETEMDSQIQPSVLRMWAGKESETEMDSQIQPSVLRIWAGKESETEMDSQIQAGKESETEMDSQIQPSVLRIWAGKESEPEMDLQIQPSVLRMWAGKTIETEMDSQVHPLGQNILGRKGSQTEKISQTQSSKESVEKFCNIPSVTGEDKHCATSLESMMDFAISKLGKNIRVISSSFAKNKNQFTVEEVKKVGERVVMCHRMNFQKVAFYCHEVNATTSYLVPLVAPDGTKSTALTVCHHDTRGMNTHMIYEMLKVKPGTIPICHFVGNKAVAWVSNSSMNKIDHPCVI